MYECTLFHVYTKKKAMEKLKTTIFNIIFMLFYIVDLLLYIIHVVNVTIDIETTQVNVTNNVLWHLFCLRHFIVDGTKFINKENCTF